MKPKKRTALLASPSAGDDRLGRLGAAEGMRAGGFQGFTVPARTIKHLENQNGMLYLEVDDKSIKHRKMLIEPLSFVLVVPPQGPGARRYMNNYINIAEDLRRRREGQARERVHDDGREAEDGLQHRVDRARA